MENKIDVFISRKSEDAHLAKKIYYFLKSKGLSVFDSDHSLAESGNSTYFESIHQALLIATHLIVVASSKENLFSPWIIHESNFFINRKISFRDKGNVISVTYGKISKYDMPPIIQYYENLPYSNGFEKLYQYVRKIEISDFELNPIINSDYSLNLDYRKGDQLLKEKKYNEA